MPCTVIATTSASAAATHPYSGHGSSVKPRASARYQPLVPVMIASVGIRNKVRGTSRSVISRRTGRSTRRRIGPRMNPMNKSIPVHINPVKTCTQLRNQRFRLTIATIITANAAATYQR